MPTSDGSIPDAVSDEIVGPVGRPFWVHRPARVPEAGGDDAAKLNAGFDTLEADFDPAGDGPLGLCLLLGDPAAGASRPEAIWPDTQMLFAGYQPDGTHIRIRYFEDAAIAPGLPNSPTLAETRKVAYALEERYRLEPFVEAGEVSDADVMALWERERAVRKPEERQRRVREVHLVAVDEDEGVVGVSSAYLQRNEQLRADLLYYRAFVARAHRKSSLAALLAVHGRELLDQRFASGEETRAPGILYEVENPGLKAYFNRALWMPTDFTFIGENGRGDHVRVHYFPGAVVPPAS